MKIYNHSSSVEASEVIFLALYFGAMFFFAFSVCALIFGVIKGA